MSYLHIYHMVTKFKCTLNTLTVDLNAENESRDALRICKNCFCRYAKFEARAFSNFRYTKPAIHTGNLPEFRHELGATSTDPFTGSHSTWVGPNRRSDPYPSRSAGDAPRRLRTGHQSCPRCHTCGDQRIEPHETDQARLARAQRHASRRRTTV